MAAKVTGDRELQFVATMDTKDFEAGAKKLVDAQKSLNSTIESGNETIKRRQVVAQQATTSEIRSIESLTVSLKRLQGVRDLANDPVKIAIYNKQIQETQLQIDRLSNAGKKGFDVMGNAIKGSTNYLSKAFSVVRNLAYLLPGIGIAGILAFATEPLLKLIASLDIFKAKITDSASRVTAFKNAFSSNEFKGAVQNVQELTINIDLAKRGLVDKDAVVKQYNESIGKTTGAVTNLDEAEKGLVKNAANFIRFTLLKAAAQLSLQKAAEEAANAELLAQQAAIGGGSALGENADAIRAANRQAGLWAMISDAFTQTGEATKKSLDKQTTEAKNKSESFLRVAQKFQEEASKLFDPVKSTQSTSGTSDDGGLARYNSLLQRIEDLKNEFIRKAQTQDEAEIQQIKDKFKKIRNEVDAFNSNPKNKYKVSVDLASAEQQAIENAVASQAVERQKIVIAQQKQVFDEFENYKLQVGETQAKKRFQNDIKNFESYVAFLKSLIPDKGDKSVTANLMRDFLKKAIPEAEAAETKRQDAILSRLLTDTQDYEQRRTALTEKYQKERALLIQKGFESQIYQLEENYEKDLHALDDSNIKKLDSYKALFDGIEDLSDRSAKVVIQNAKDMLKKAFSDNKISTDLFNQINKAIDKAEKSLGQRAPARLLATGAILRDLASKVSDIDEEFSKVLATIGDIISAVGDVKLGIEAFKSAESKGDLFGQFTAAAGIFGSVIGAVRGVFKLFDNSARREAQAARDRELQIKQNEAITKALERQLSLIKEIYGSERLTAYRQNLEEITKQTAEFTKQINGAFSLSGDLQIDALIKKISGGQSLDKVIKDARANQLDLLVKSGLSLKNAIPLADDYALKIRTIIEANSLAGKSIEDLQQLLDKGLLDDVTASAVQQLITLEQQYKDTLNAFRAETTGTTIDQLSDSITQLFANATTSAEDFGKNFEEIIKTSILKSFTRNSLEKGLQNFYEELAKLSESNGGLDASEIAKLKELYFALTEKAKKDFGDLQNITGVSFDPSTGTGGTNSLRGSIQASLTEETGTILAGVFKGVQLNTYNIQQSSTAAALNLGQIYTIATQQLTLTQQIADNTKRSADATEVAVTELKGINKNTGESLAIALRAAGQ